MSTRTPWLLLLALGFVACGYTEVANLPPIEKATTPESNPALESPKKLESSDAVRGVVSGSGEPGGWELVVCWDDGKVITGRELS